jgi:hypothetical protein
MSLQVVVAVEALRTLVALERPVVLRVRLSLRVMAVHVLHVRCVSTVVCWHHRGRHTTDQSELTVWVSDVGQDRTWQRVLV